MKFNLSKEWCEQAAKLEGDSEVGAGCPPTEPTRADLLARVKELESQLMDWENREASCCPENTPFEEVIKRLKSTIYQRDTALFEARDLLLNLRISQHLSGYPTDQIDQIDHALSQIQACEVKK